MVAENLPLRISFALGAVSGIVVGPAGGSEGGGRGRGSLGAQRDSGPRREQPAGRHLRRPQRTGEGQVYRPH